MKDLIQQMVEEAREGHYNWVRLDCASSTEVTEKNPLITFKIKMPKFLDAQFQKYSFIASNSASTRAIPLATQLARNKEDIFIPPVLTKNKKGMAGGDLLPLEDYDEVEKKLITFYYNILEPFVEELGRTYNIHKQHIGRYLEPFLYTSLVATANLNEWRYLISQRKTVHAQPEFCRIAVQLDNIIEEDIINAKKVTQLQAYEWHLPLLSPAEREWVATDCTWFKFNALNDPTNYYYWALISAARCARTSYLDGEELRLYSEDLRLAERLLTDGHMSPFDHPARLLRGGDYDAYYHPRRGWMCKKFNNFTPLRAVIEGRQEFDNKLKETLL